MTQIYCLVLQIETEEAAKHVVHHNTFYLT